MWGFPEKKKKQLLHWSILKVTNLLIEDYLLMPSLFASMTELPMILQIYRVQIMPPWRSRKKIIPRKLFYILSDIVAQVVENVCSMKNKKDVIFENCTIYYRFLHYDFRVINLFAIFASHRESL